MSTESHLRSEALQWRAHCCYALLRYERRTRHEQGQPLLSPNAATYIPENLPRMLRLLNWKVWTLRYCVGLDFVLSTLLMRYKKHRRVLKDPNKLVLGLGVGILTGTAARKVIEERIKDLYPNGENYAAAKAQVRLSYRTLAPVDGMPLTSVDTMIERYTQIMLKRQSASDPVFTRPWRGNPWL